MVRAMTERNRRESAGPWRDRLEPSTDEARYRALVENLPAVIYQVAPAHLVKVDLWTSLLLRRSAAPLRYGGP